MKRYPAVQDRGQRKEPARTRRVLEILYVPDGKGWALGVFAIGAILTGLAQNILLTYSSFSGFNLMDDTFIVLMFLVAILRLLRRLNAPALICLVWMLSCGVALWRTIDEGILTSDSAFFLFRQVCMPVLVVVSGLAMTRREWSWIIKVGIGVIGLNVAYIGLEVAGVRIVDPAPFAMLSKTAIYPNGLPGYYMSYDLSGNLIARAGGLYLNPPTTGIATGTAAVLAFYALRSRWRLLLALAFALATVATISRAGILLMVIGLAGPFLSRKLHPLVALPAMSVPVLVAGNNIADLGNSDSHVDGLTVGLGHAFDSVIGRGFGYVGNFAGKLGSVQEASESLSGIAFSAVGLIAVAIYVLALGRLGVTIVREPRRWEQYLAFGALIIAMLAETAGSMNATVPLWLIVGAAMVPKSPPVGTNQGTGMKNASAPPQHSVTGA